MSRVRCSRPGRSAHSQTMSRGMPTSPPTPVLCRLAAICFDPIAVRIDDECRVIGRIVFRPQSRLAIVTSAGLEGSRMEFVDGSTARCLEAEMQPGCVVCGHRPFGLIDQEYRLLGAIGKRRGTGAQA